MITLTQDRIKKGLLYTYIKMFHMGQNSMETVPSPLILTLPPLFWATLTASSNIIDNWDVGWDVDVVGEGTPTSEFVYIVGNPVYSLSITIKGLRGNQSRNWRLYCSLILFNRFSSLVSTSDTPHCSNPLNLTWITFLRWQLSQKFRHMM